MARKPATAPAFDFNAVTVAPTVLPKVDKVSAPNPLAPIYAKSLNEGQALAMTIPDGAVKEAETLLRRAAVAHDGGIKIRKEEHGDGNTTLHFEAKAEKNARAYTSADVREWAKTNGYSDDMLTPKIHVSVSDAYREAHGYKAIKRA